MGESRELLSAALPGCSGGPGTVCRLLYLLWEGGGGRARWRGGAEGALPPPPSDAVQPLLKTHAATSSPAGQGLGLRARSGSRTQEGLLHILLLGRAVGTEQVLEQPLLTLRPLQGG